jgi:signal transduction histidine kinase
MDSRERRESDARYGAAGGEPEGGRGEGLGAEPGERCAALEGENRALRDAARQASLMLASFSYELRTPLTVILGFAELLLRHEKLSARQRDYCEKIEGAGYHLHLVIKHLIDLSRLEAGATAPPAREFSLGAMLGEACAVVEPLARKRGVSLDCSSAPERDALVSDEGKLRQIFGNLLFHAVARSPSRGIVRVATSALDGGRLAVEIGDEGEPPEFPTPSKPGDEAWGFSCPGISELELSVARRAVGVLGGSISLAGREPRGLVVRVELPARAPGS